MKSVVFVLTAKRMDHLAKTMPGFLSIKTFTAPDGERVSLVEFDSEESHQAWRQHPAHREAQRLGRERFYSEFQIQVCRVERAHGMPAKAAQPSHAKT